MSPPAVEFPPTSIPVGACGSVDGSAVPQASRPRFIKVRRHLKSRTVPSDQKSSASDSFGSVPAGSDRVKISDGNGNVHSRGNESVRVSSSSDHAGFSFTGAGRTSVVSLNSSENHADFGKKGHSDFVFGSSQFHPASNSNSDSKGVCEHFGKLNLGDNWKMKVEAAAGNQGAKASDAIFNFHSEGNWNLGQGLESGVFVFKGNAHGSSIHDESRGGKSSGEVRSRSIDLDLKNQDDNFDVADRAKASDLNSEVMSEAAFRLRKDAEASQLCQGNLPAASVEHIKNPNIEVCDAVQNDRKSQIADENIFVFGSCGNFSSQSAGNSSCGPSVYVANADPSSLKTNLFSKSTGFEFSQKSDTRGRKITEKKGKSMKRSAVNLSTGKQYLPEEKNADENSSTSNCYSPMDFSPYQESRVDHLSSQEVQTNEPLSGNCVPKLSCLMETTDGGFDVSSSSGDRLGKIASGSTRIVTVSGTETAAHQPDSDRVCSGGTVNSISLGSEKSDQGSFAFSSSASPKISSLSGKDQLRKSNVEHNSASSASTTGSTVKDASFSIRGESGSTSDKRGSLKKAPVGEPTVSRKLRPRLMKLRKHSHGRSEAASTHTKANPIYAVPDGLFQVKLNYADSSTLDNTATQDVNYSYRNASLLFGGSGRTSASKSNESVEEYPFSECGKHDNIASFSDANYGGLQSTSQFYEGKFPTGVNGSDCDDKKVFGCSNGFKSFCNYESMSKCRTEEIGEKMGNLSSTDSGKDKTSVESGFVFGSSRFPTDWGSDDGVFIFKSSSKRSSIVGESSLPENDHGTKPNVDHLGSTCNIFNSGNHGLDVGGKDESDLSPKLPDGMQKLDIHDGENTDGNHRSKVTGHGEPHFVFRSGTDASDMHADSFPSSCSDQIKNQNTGVCDSVENGSNIRSAGKDHFMFGHGDRVPGEFPSTASNKPFIFRTGSTETAAVINGAPYKVNSGTPLSEDGRKDALGAMSPADGRQSSKDPSMLNRKSCLFPEPNTEFKFCGRAGSLRKKKLGKQGKLRSYSRDKVNIGKQNVTREDHLQEKAETPYCFSSMDFSPSNEHEAVNQFSRKSSAEPADDCLQGFSTGEEGLDIDNKNTFSFRENYFNADTENLCNMVGDGISSIRDSDVNLSKTEERPSQMQFSFASRVEKENQGGFVFSASTPVGLGPPGRKRLHKKRNSAQRASVSFVLHPNSNSSTTLPSETTSGSRGDASCVHEDEVKSSLKGRETCEQKEVSSSASIQEACEKWRFRGNQAYKNGHFSRAERFYTKGINSVPSHETSGCCLKPLLLCYSNRAASRMSVGRLREAIDDCTRAAVLDPNFLKVQIRAANCHLVLGEIENALSCFNKCLESGANVCLDRRLIIDAADGLQRAQKVAEYIKLSAKILEEKCSDAESRALEIISEAMSISKFSEKLLQMKAEALYKSRKYQEVVQLCDQSLIIAEKNFSTLDTPNGSEDVDDSKCEGKMSVRLWRFLWMAKSNFCLGRLDEALDLLRKVERTGCISDGSLSEFMASAASLSSTIRKLLDCKNSGNEAFRSKKYAEAVEHYTTALSSSSESRPFAAICFCNRAAAHQALGQIADAIADCSLAIALDGNYAKAVSRRATLHELIRHYEQAAADDCKLISILQSQSNQKNKASGGPSDRANELKKAYKHKSSMEEEAKKEIHLDFYHILGVKKTDTAADIKKAYRKAVLRHHPDKAGQLLRNDNGYDGQLWKEIAELVHEDADRLFKIIGEAYAVLSDSSKRAKYDLEEETR
ncbi:uncharacterized protein LOC116197602 [Punica granatum]|uniref:Uncharacterized protein LOC116197602 n=1 Tax=Punica granatum TaxID=22663 RepID=A0A218X2H5_PUNGR|nr:uncharacterized protein LOC116197602 [Punica granatum]OWM78929.1 hypothetical protein CDL15_Pgr003100 [Punica granatum]